ncbi:MAG: PIG-L family deacetylase [Candidatus Bathyarchaeia archaeon]|nr:PIG-L family deacetylase [Candidatus Bathyarchaeota archaeon]
MKFRRDTAEFYVPDGRPFDEALRRTTHMGICAHQDDLEIMAIHGILECFMADGRGFLGVTVTDGRGSPRGGPYASYSDEEIRRVRMKEQRKASVVGEYSGVVFLDYPSSELRGSRSLDVVMDLRDLISLARPKTIYTHNPADKHDTHVAVALRVIEALRMLPEESHPKRLYGCEVWRDLDWMLDEDKVVLDVSAHENLSQALLGVYDSQILGGKRYDLAAIGRRRSHATYNNPQAPDASSALVYAMDLTPLIREPKLSIVDYVIGYIDRFRRDVSDRLERLLQDASVD